MYAWKDIYIYNIYIYILQILGICIPHEKLLGMQQVSNSSTESKRISTPAHVLVIRIGKGR